MNIENNSSPPDPAATLLSGSMVRPKDRLNELKERYETLVWCRAGRDADHDCCEPFKVLDDALKIAKELGCSILDPWPSKKSERLMVGQYLTSRLWNCECARGEEIKEEKFTKTLDTPLHAAEYLLWRVKELGVSDQGVERPAPEPPKMYWDVSVQKYCVKRSGDGEWQHENKENAADRLIEVGLDPHPGKNELSEVN
jgi:hypothetical protein